MSELKSQNRKHKKGIECNIRSPYKISCGNNNPLFYHNHHTNKNIITVHLWCRYTYSILTIWIIY